MNEKAKHPPDKNTPSLERQRHYNRTHVQTRVDEDVRLQLVRAADEQDLPLSQVVREVLTRWARRR